MTVATIAKHTLIVTSLLFSLVGCASADKLTMPKGKWIAVNPTGFIPPNTEVYKRPKPQPQAIVDSTEYSESTELASTVQPTTVAVENHTGNLLKDTK